MTDAELYVAIQADLAARALAAAGDDLGVAARMAAVLPPEVISLHATERTLFAAFAEPADAVAFLSGLQIAAATNPALMQALSWLAPSEGGIDVGFASVRSMLDALAAAGAITTAAAATVKALAERPAVVAVSDVSRTLLRDRPGGKVPS